MTKVIAISGKAGSGKDTFAAALSDALLEQGKRVIVTHYADLLKYICKSFFGWNGKKDKAGRSLLQYVGTDIIRAEEPDFWVDFIVFILEMFGDHWDYVLIPDARFPNEIDVIKEAGFEVTHIRVVRDCADGRSKLTNEQQNHSSETALFNVEPDIWVKNSSTKAFLREVAWLMARDGSIASQAERSEILAEQRQIINMLGGDADVYAGKNRLGGDAHKSNLPLRRDALCQRYRVKKTIHQRRNIRGDGGSCDPLYLAV